MLLLKSFGSIQQSSARIFRNQIKQFSVSQHLRDNNDSELTTDVKSEESKLIAQIHQDYASEVLVKLESKEDKEVTEKSDQSSELIDKYAVRFQSRLDHFRRSGFIAKPVLINAPNEPKLNPVLDKTIDIMKGTTEAHLIPTEIYTENSDNRSLEYFPPATQRTVQKFHDEEPVETTLGFPVIRAPHPMDRITEGFRMTKSSRKDYPYIQDFQSHYDIVIIGGGLVGSFIAYSLTERLETKYGCKVAVVEKDLSYRRSVSTTSPLGLRVQHSLPELIEMSLYGSDFYRLIGKKLAVPFDEIATDEEYFNIPNIKFQPHGHLTLATEAQMEELGAAHEVQTMAGVQAALLTAKQIKKRFPWINTHNIEGGCLGLESEGWFDSWNLLQAVKLKNKHQGVDYINGEVIYFKKHKIDHMGSSQIYMGYHHDGSKVPIGRNFEAHLLLPDSQHVYPLHFSQCILAGGGNTGDLGRMCGIGDGYGPLAVEIPVEKRRGYVFTVDTHQAGPGLNCPLTTDISGLYIRREGHAGQFLVSMFPEDNNIPVSIHGDVHPDYWENTIHPILKDRFDGFDHATVIDSQPIDYDVNYFDGSPIIGPHPYVGNMWMACGFGGYGGSLAPAVGRALTELIYDNGYHTTDLSRLAFDRVLLSRAVNENSTKMFLRNQATN